MAEDAAALATALAQVNIASNGINKSDIVELKSFAKPAALVKEVMGFVSLLLRENTIEWKEVQKMIRSPSFLMDIKSCNVEEISQSTMDKLDVFINSSRFSIADMKRVSKACSPLFNWLIVCSDYAKIAQNENVASITNGALEESGLEDHSRSSEKKTPVFETLPLQFSLASDMPPKSSLQCRDVSKEIKTALSMMNRRDLNLIKGMGAPPELVKVVMESSCALLSFPSTTWKCVQGVISCSNFLPAIKDFKTESVTELLLQEMQKYVSRPDFTVRRVKEVCSACVPFLMWVKTQVTCAASLRR